MSVPPILDLPRCARALPVETERGRFAALRAEPPGGADDVRATVLLVPGFTGSKEDFLAMLEPLAAAGVRTLAFDQRGQFESGGPDDPAAYAMQELARDLLAVRRTLGAEAPHLVGHSFGGLVARAAVIAEPTAWASLTLLSSGPAAIQPSEAERTRMLVDALRTMSLAQIWEFLDHGPGGAVSDFLRRRWLANVPTGLDVMARQLMAEPDRVARLAEVAPRVLVLGGEEDYAWPVEWQDEMATRLGARRVRVAGGDHSPNASRPKETAAELVDFVCDAGHR